MTTYDAGEFTLEKVREFVWEIPQTGEMNAPARVLASESLLDEISQDKTLEQLRNATHLPGVQKHALCMPDGHQGYGFPVGGVAGIDAQNGCISPGAVGYDINCLPGDTSVRLSFGRKKQLAELESTFEDKDAMVAGDSLVDSPICLFTASGEKPVYEIETKHGDTIRATADHEFVTDDEKRKLDNLELGDEVRVNPLTGIEDEDPESFTVLGIEDFADADPQIRSTLEESDILPLRSTDDEFNRLLKLVGFHTGDGSFSSGGQTWFYGDPNDLESIREDIKAIGFTPSRIYEREREHEVDGNTFERTEYSFKATAKSFQLLLEKLGAPTGKKIEAGFTAPEYLQRVTTWQRALYYSAYFGAEMSAPSAQHRKNLYCPKVSQNRTIETADTGRMFLQQMVDFLAELDIETNSIEELESDSNSTNEMVRLRLGIKNDSQNLIRFFSTVGYRYNLEKQRKAVVALQYLKRKEYVIGRRETIANEAKAMADGGVAVGDIRAEFDINDRFIERSIWGDGRSGRPRSGADFPDYDEFAAQVTVDDDLTITSEITAIEKVGEKPVFDIGVEHEAHNFIADGFVVSNCGVRMMRTNLTYDDVRGHEEDLVEALFDAIPSGLGGGGIHEGTEEDVEEILSRGMDWALEAGYAIQSDLEHCEDEGYRPEGDPDRISQKAKDRGKNQIGSLGSGNHFLEVQRVTDVFRAGVAREFGLTEDQIVVLIHCGSRGLGHQVCTDYLRDIEQAHAGLLDQLPDKELAAAPAGSQLADDYYAAMCGAINFAWVNRQLIMHRTREVFADVFGRDWQDMEMELLYDVAHNIAKRETHTVDGEEKELFVHRKGATRAFPAGRPEVPAAYRDVGQPIIIPGSMGAGSYVLRGGERSLDETFGSTAHGAGRLMSRTEAKNTYWGEDVQDDLREQEHIYVKAQSGATVAEEAPGVYKDVDEVVRVSDALGIGDKVARTFPVANIKG